MRRAFLSALLASAAILTFSASASAESVCVARYYKAIDYSRSYGGPSPMRAMPVAPRPYAGLPAPPPTGGVKKKKAGPSEATAPPPPLVAPEARLAHPGRPGGLAPTVPPQPGQILGQPDRDAYPDLKANKPQLTAENPVSTFGADVDTASYTLLARMLREGRQVRPDAIRIEEIVNYFDYGYRAPDSIEDGFRPDIAILPSPWNSGRKLVRIGVKAFEVAKDKRPAANLVFLMDTSGSMFSIDRLPLAKVSVCLLLDELRADDTISVVTYAGDTRVALPPTKASEKEKLLAVLDGLESGGSTAGAGGIQLAYAQAKAGFIEGGVNRVILMTDGDFNVGISSPQALKGFITEKRQTGVHLTVLGYGMGNYQDSTMQILAEAGNGQAGYVGSIADARRAMTRGLGGALYTVATDTKFQVEFNPAKVKEWRLVGFESRALARSDFSNDRVDSGDVPAGQSVTVIYEIVPAGKAGDVEPLRYAKPADAPAAGADEYGFLRLRFKKPGSATSKLLELPITAANESAELALAPESARFAVAVAWVAQILRQDPSVDSKDRVRAIELAKAAIGADPTGDRLDFVAMMLKAGG